MSHRLGCLCLFIITTTITAAGCARGAADGTDAAVDARPFTLGSGTSLGIVSAHDLGAALPANAQALVDTLVAATDDPDDPVRFILDHMLAELPAGTATAIAGDVEPIVAAYLDDRIADIAPTFIPGMRALAEGTSLIARQFGTLETLSIAGRERRRPPHHRLSVRAR